MPPTKADPEYDVWSTPMTPSVAQPRTMDVPAREGKVKTGILLWLLGVPIPIILLILAIRGCA